MGVVAGAGVLCIIAAVPAAAASLYLFASAKKPMRGSDENAFIHPAVSVHMSSHAVGRRVTHA